MSSQRAIARATGFDPVEGAVLEISGIDRLFALARELGVDATRRQGAPRAEQDAAAERPTRRGARDDAGGVRISLSSAAREASEPPRGTKRPGATPSMPPPAAGEADAPTRRASRRNSAAIAAYQRTATSLPGETVRIRA